DWQALLALAEALRQLNQLLPAREAAQAAIVLAPAAAEAHYALAQVNGQLGHFAETVAATEEAIRLDPHQPRYYGYRAQLCYAQGHCTDAIRYAETGLRLDAEQPHCLLWRALAQEATQQPNAADQDFAQLLRVAPGSAVVHARLGQLLLLRNNFAAAAPHLAEALRQDPSQAFQLMPLLRHARQQATLPGWLHRAVQRELQARAADIAPGFGSLLVRVALVAHAVWRGWFPRPDALFPMLDPPPLRRPWATTPLAWLGLTGLVSALIYVNATQHLRVGPAICVLAILALRYMHQRQQIPTNTAFA
ncbi:tetratricopeptide repeat protein, partial [Hymenobacter agri]